MMRGRVASAPLRQMGLEHELLARSEADYVERAVALAGDDDRVRELRHIIRERAPTLLDTIEAPRALGALLLDGRPPAPRSEEHTSELQSLMRIPYAVFCLKKKNKRH